MTSGSGLTVTRDGCTLTVAAGPRPSPTGRVAHQRVRRPRPHGQRRRQRDDARSPRPAHRRRGPGRPGRRRPRPRELVGAGLRRWRARSAPTPRRGPAAPPGSQACTASPCTIDGLTNGKDYFFTVTATNVVGESDPGGPSTAARPDTKPGPVPGVTMAEPWRRLLDDPLGRRPRTRARPSPSTSCGSSPDGGGSAAHGRGGAPADDGRPRSSRARQHERVLRRRPGLQRGRPGPFGAGSDDAVGRHAAGPDRPQGLGRRPRSQQGPRGHHPHLEHHAPQRPAARRATPSSGASTAAPGRRSRPPGQHDHAPRTRCVYDGRRYDYVVTATNGADLESPNSNVQSFTSIGMPVDAVGERRDARPTTRRSGSRSSLGSRGPAASRPSPGPPPTATSGTRLVQRHLPAPAAGHDPHPAARHGRPQTFRSRPPTARARPTRRGRSNQVQPYGPTPRPEPERRLDLGAVASRYNWTLPDQRPAHHPGRGHRRGQPRRRSDHLDLGAAATSRRTSRSSIRAYSEGGESPALEMTRRTDNPPEPEVYNVHPGSGSSWTSPATASARAPGSPGMPRGDVRHPRLHARRRAWRASAVDVGNDPRLLQHLATITVTGPTAYSTPYRPIFGRGVGQHPRVVEINGSSDRPTTSPGWIPTVDAHRTEIARPCATGSAPHPQRRRRRAMLGRRRGRGGHRLPGAGSGHEEDITSGRGVPRGRRGVASVGVVAIAASMLTYAAVTSQGSTVHEAEVGDGGVWVSSSAQAKFGRLNTQARQLDAGVSTALADGSKVDILQDGAAVVGVATGNTLLPIDVRTATSEDSGAAAPAPLPSRRRPVRPRHRRPARRHDRHRRPEDRQGLGAARRHQGRHRVAPGHRRHGQAAGHDRRQRRPSPSTPAAPSSRRPARPAGSSPSPRPATSWPSRSP